MAHDIVIRGGTVADGTGGDLFEADIAVDGDVISAIGKVSGGGDFEINARDKCVSPGFVDLHTHLDAQIGWEPEMTSVTWHGVTTALLGNCGVTFAPCKATDREFLAGMMETVEDIPKYAILNGLPWDWESYGDYLNSIERLDPMINVAGLVGHSATRFYVMGERAISEQATPEEIEQIAALAGQSVKEGAVGFSVNRHPGHVLPDGRPIPGTFASRDELLAIAREVGANGGIMQTVPHYGNLPEEIELLAQEGESAPILFSALAEHRVPLDEGVKTMRARGIDVIGVTVPRAGGGCGGVMNNIYCSYWGTPAWSEFKAMDFNERLNAIRDESMRSRLIDEVKNNEERREFFLNHTKHHYYMGGESRPKFDAKPGESLASIAAACGEHPVETWVRLALETDGKALFHVRTFNFDLDHVAEMISTDWAMPGLGDAGAHVSQMMDSGWATFVLSYWHRDQGLYSLPEAVRRISAVPAGVLGLQDRGHIRVGMKADLNVIDIDALEEHQPYIVNDLPGGAPRFQQRASGYLATICNGRMVLRNDEHTGVRGGQVLRNQSRNH